MIVGALLEGRVADGKLTPRDRLVAEWAARSDDEVVPVFSAAHPVRRRALAKFRLGPARGAPILSPVPARWLRPEGRQAPAAALLDAWAIGRAAAARGVERWIRVRDTWPRCPTGRARTFLRDLDGWMQGPAGLPLLTVPERFEGADLFSRDGDAAEAPAASTGGPALAILWTDEASDAGDPAGFRALAARAIGDAVASGPGRVARVRILSTAPERPRAAAWLEDSAWRETIAWTDPRAVDEADRWLRSASRVLVPGGAPGETDLQARRRAAAVLRGAALRAFERAVFAPLGA